MVGCKKEYHVKIDYTQAYSPGKISLSRVVADAG